MADPGTEMIVLNPDGALERVEAVFTPGKLAEKRAQLAQLRDSGDTMLFDGAVDWSLMLTASDRHMSGYALSLDEAFADIIACLDHVAASEDSDSEVICAVSNADDDTEASDA